MKQPVTHEQMAQMFSSYQDANIEIIHSMQTAVNATTKAETDRIDVKMDTMVKRQVEMNHSVAENIQAIAINNETTKRIKKVSSNAKWYVFGLFAFCYAVCWIYNTFNLEEIVLKLIHKI